MSVKYVILGYLSWKPMTGYDIKKIIADSETLPWSASNNQIYHALVQLHDDGWVSRNIEGQIGAPDRHVYTITKTGGEALRDWAGGEPNPPPTKNPLFYQLMWADCLETEAIDQVLESYSKLIGEKLFLISVQGEKKTNAPNRTPREAFLWEMISRNWIAHYKLELNWVRQMRQDLHNLKPVKTRQ